MDNDETKITNMELFLVFIGGAFLVLGVGYIEYWLLMLIGAMSIFLGVGSIVVRKTKNKSD